MKTDTKRDADQNKLTGSVDRQVERLRQAERDKPTLLAQTRFVGAVGLLFILPVVAGAYFGLWLDEKMPGYTVHWTVSMVFLGVVVGAVNVYYFVRD